MIFFDDTFRCRGITRLFEQLMADVKAGLVNVRIYEDGIVLESNFTSGAPANDCREGGRSPGRAFARR